MDPGTISHDKFQRSGLLGGSAAIKVADTPVGADGAVLVARGVALLTIGADG